MEADKTKDQKLNSEQEIVSLVFPKNREAYMQKLFGQVGLAAFVVWIIFFKSENDNIYVIALSSLIGISLLVVLYEKIAFLFKVDKLTITPDSFQLSYKNQLVRTCPFKKIGLKIASDIGGSYEVSFYNLSENKKLFYCKENDVDKNDLQALLLYLEKITDIDANVMKKGTHGEVIPLIADFNDISHSNSLARYYDKYYFYNVSGYGWMIYPFIVIVVLATLYFIN
ncbi:hypothetical protein [Hydrogenimonas sp.]